MKDYILKLVEKTIAKHHTRDPYEIADNLKINVWKRDIGKIKGYYNVCLKNRYIVINQNILPEEQRIVCAHELGHDQLHRHFAQYAPLQDIMLYDMTLKPEYEANIYASSLLISDEDIIQYRDYTVEQAAKFLKTSEQYVSLKLQLLNKKAFI